MKPLNWVELTRQQIKARHTFGDNQELATKHYVEYGFNEGRLF